MIGYLEVLAAVSIWGIINGLVIKGVKGTSAIAIGTWMSWIGVLIFVAISGEINPFAGLNNNQASLLIGLGLAAALNNTLFYTALKMTFVYNAALLHYFASVLVILLIAFTPVFKESLAPIDIIAVILGFIGLAIITLPSFTGGSKKWIFFAAGSAIFYSFEMVFSRIVSTNGIPAETSAFVKLLAQGILMPLAAIPLKQSLNVKSFKEGGQILGAGVLLYLSFILYFSGVGVVPVKHSAVLGYVDRIGAILLGAYFFKEKLTRYVWLGGGLILGASLLVVFFR